MSIRTKKYFVHRTGHWGQQWDPLSSLRIKKHGKSLKRWSGYTFTRTVAHICLWSVSWIIIYYIPGVLSVNWAPSETVSCDWVTTKCFHLSTLDWTMGTPSNWIQKAVCLFLLCERSFRSSPPHLPFCLLFSRSRMKLNRQIGQ